MIRDLDKNAQQTMEKVLSISKLQAVGLGLIIVKLYFSTWNFYAFVLRGTLAIIFFALFFRATKRLLYSYWAFLGLLTLYTLSFFIDLGPRNISLGEFLILSTLLALNIFQARMMMRPIYYPRPNWWEYDFRYRSDLKARLTTKDKHYPIRISDVRMGEVSIYSFHELESGERVLVDNIDEMDEDFSLALDVVTVRSNIVGRPDIVGLKLADEQDIVHYNKLRRTMHSRALSKKRFIRYE